MEEKHYVVLQHLFYVAKKYYQLIEELCKSISFTDREDCSNAIAFLTSKELIEKDGAFLRITHNGKVILHEYQEERFQSYDQKDLEYLKTQKEVEDLQNRINDFKPSKRRTWYAIVISIIALVLSMLLVGLQCSGK
jgi:hypothetical protein